MAFTLKRRPQDAQVDTVDLNKVADYFIWRAHEVGEPISQLKLQKLVYYAQAWNLALKGTPLVKAEFQAWVHGPVNRQLYDRFKQYAWKPITDEVEMPKLPKDVLEHLEEVWQVYGVYSPFELERLTHSELPWQKARGGLAPDENCEVIISKTDMMEFFRSRLHGEGS